MSGASDIQSNVRSSELFGTSPHTPPTRGGKAYACASAARNISMQMRKSWIPLATFILSYVVQLSRRSTPAYTRMAMAMPCVRGACVLAMGGSMCVMERTC